jgi:hypothetical protein
MYLRVTSNLSYCESTYYGLSHQSRIPTLKIECQKFKATHRMYVYFFKALPRIRPAGIMNNEHGIYPIGILVQIVPCSGGCLVYSQSVFANYRDPGIEKSSWELCHTFYAYVQTYAFFSDGGNLGRCKNLSRHVERISLRFFEYI